MGKRHNTIVVNLQNERAMMATGIVPLSSPLLTYQNNKIQIKYEEKVTRQKAEWLVGRHAPCYKPKQPKLLVLGRYTEIISNRYPIFWNTDTYTYVGIRNTEKYRQLNTENTESRFGICPQGLKTVFLQLNWTNRRVPSSQ